MKHESDGDLIAESQDELEVRAELDAEGKTEKTKREPDPDADAYTISQFCRKHGNSSRGFYYGLKQAGLAPREIRVGRRVMISKEAAADWRREREASCAQ